MFYFWPGQIQFAHFGAFKLFFFYRFEFQIIFLATALLSKRKVFANFYTGKIFVFKVLVIFWKTKALFNLCDAHAQPNLKFCSNELLTLNLIGSNACIFENRKKCHITPPYFTQELNTSYFPLQASSAGIHLPSHSWKNLSSTGMHMSSQTLRLLARHLPLQGVCTLRHLLSHSA